jgi:hypothetical protein
MKKETPKFTILLAIRRHDNGAEKKFVMKRKKNSLHRLRTMRWKMENVFRCGNGRFVLKNERFERWNWR